MKNGKKGIIPLQTEVRERPQITAPENTEGSLETLMGIGEGKIKQMNFLDMQEVPLTDYEAEALAANVKNAAEAKQAAEAAQIKMQQAQAEIQAANNQVAVANIAQNTIFDLIRRRAGYPNKQNWYDPNKQTLIIDPN